MSPANHKCILSFISIRERQTNDRFHTAKLQEPHLNITFGYGSLFTIAGGDERSLIRNKNQSPGANDAGEFPLVSVGDWDETKV